MKVPYTPVTRTICVSKIIILFACALTAGYYAWRFSDDILNIYELIKLSNQLSNIDSATLLLSKDSRIYSASHSISEKVTESDLCNGELMRYTIFDSLNTENGTVLHKAEKKFDCENRKYLENYQLLDKHKIGDIKAEFPKVFVIAGNVDFFPSVRAVIASIQSVFFKDKFQSSYRIIFYDLGGISADPAKKMELTRVCNLEFRVFDWKQLPENVHDLKIFAWKVIILAEMFKQFNSFVYLDSSVDFLESALRSPQFTWKEANWQPDDRFQIYTRLYGDGKISAVSFTHEAEHGIKFATHPGMYSYIPMEPAYDLMNDIEMHEANFIIVHKSEMTRQWLKWSVLCAVTRDCIEPPGAQLFCDQESKVPPGSCHRQDQSVLNILLNNLEMTMLRQGSKIVTHQSPYNHPSRYYYGHVLRRRQSTTKQLLRCPKKRKQP